MSLLQRIKSYLFKQQEQAEAAQAEAVAVEPEEPQSPEELEPEAPAEIDQADDSGDTVAEFERATDVQPTEPPAADSKGGRRTPSSGGDGCCDEAGCTDPC